MQLKKLKRQRATDEVYEALRQAILSSLFKSGERLQVDDIADKLGVSLTPVRHAIQQLATEGLVEIRPRSGTFVTSLSVEEVEETFEVRDALERLAAEKAITRITEEQIGRMKDLASQMRQPVDSARDQRAQDEASIEFHRTLVRASGNRKLAEMFESLNAHIKIARIRATENGWRTRQVREQDEYAEIVKALAARDRERLVKALAKHVDNARESLIKAIRQAESGTAVPDADSTASDSYHAAATAP